MKRIHTLALVALFGAISVAAQTENAYKRFLTTYLPLPDRLSLDTAYIGRHVRLAIHARNIMPWGATLHEREFLHFVLPPRVADETLDDSRVLLLDSLAPRLIRLTPQEAVLEVNHWCRAHATLRTTDSRTLSPAATIATAYGNPTELAVLLTAALRAVAIPARLVSATNQQWTDPEDTSVWVEAYVNGGWHSIEPCQPEPSLDKGRHLQTASQAKLIHTFVFGQYETEEPVIEKGELITELNRKPAYTTAPRTKSNNQRLDQQQRKCKQRIQLDDAQRTAHEAAMTNQQWRGNAPTIETFLAGPWDKRMAQTLLSLLTEKDLHDIPLEVLYDNLYTQAATQALNDVQMRYVVNPRIENESLTPYKWLLRQHLAHIGSIHQLVAFCRDSITLVTGQNPMHLRQSPRSTYIHRQADVLGKKIFFVAAARSLGWATRIKPEDGRLQWSDGTIWHEVPPLSWSEVAEER